MLETQISFFNQNQRLVGMTHAPDGEGRAPAVLMLHGFKGTRIESHFLFVKMARRLAKAGYFVMRFDFRGSGESEGQFKDISIPGEIDDASAALAWLRQHPGVDPERIALLGLSMGGCVAASVAGEDPRIAGLILWSAVADPLELAQNTASEAPAAEYPLGIQADGTLDMGGYLIGLPFLESMGQVKPLQSVQNFKGPALILHGTADKTVLPTHAKRYYQTIGPARAEQRWIQGADHTYSAHLWEEEVFSLTLAWLRQKIPADNSAPQKPETLNLKQTKENATMTKKYNAIVIGAGLGGLSAAAHLAKEGKSVLLLEHHTVPGGYAHEFRRGHYRFEVSLHAVDGVSPGGWTYTIMQELGILDAVKFHRLDPFYTIRYPDDEFTVPADIFAYEAELIRRFPAEAEGIRRLFDAMLKTFTQTRRYASDVELNRRPPLTEMPARYPDMLKAMTITWDDYLSEYVSDAKAKGVLSATWAYYGLPAKKLAAAAYILPWVSFHLFGGFYPEGGSMAISRAFEAVIKQHGGEIKYRQTVTRIEIKDGQAAAVETERGLRAEAEVIISNANAPDTMLKFVGRENLPPKYVKRVEKPKNSLANLIVYLGLKRNLLAEGWAHHELFVVEGYNTDEDYQNMLKGEFDKTGMVISHYNQYDPACAPDGGSVLVLTSLSGWDYANQWGTGGNLSNYHKNPHYLELKKDAAEKLIARAEKLIPGLRDAIVYQEVATPLTNYHYTLNPGGGIYGSEQTVDNMYRNRLKAKTPVPNLFLTGAWVFGGGQSAAMLSGRNTARMALGYLEGKSVGEWGESRKETRRGGDKETGRQGDKEKPETKNPKPETRNALTCKETIALMPYIFNADAAGDLVADIQFHVTGDEPGDYILRIAGGECAFEEGLSAAPRLSITTPSEVWLKISRGELNPQMAFMTRKYTVEGDMGLLMKMGKLFKASM